jgi:endoglucanase
VRCAKLLTLASLASATVLGFLPVSGQAASASLSISVSGNHLVTGSGAPIRLLGVNRSGTEYACIQGWGIFDGPNDAASVAAMASWHINAVRIPLNEDCWLNLNGVNAAYGGANYQNALQSYVSLLHQYGLYAVLDLHWNAPGSQPATGQQVMADADHGPAFWSSVATTFKADPAVLFDVYNEPHDISWSCWLNGCNAPGWNAAGMQSLVNAIRATGATQPIMLGGLAWSNDLSGWLANEPTDPASALVASFHNYNFNLCDSSCWNTTVAPVASRVPVVTGEIGEDDCAHGFIDQYMGWADSLGISYVGWTWDTWDCAGGPALIADYSGTPTAFGVGFRDHLATLADGWTSLGGALIKGPAASVTSGSRLDVFGVGTDQALWLRWWNGTSWSNWGSLGGRLTSSPAVASQGNRIDVFARATDNALWHLWFNGSTWSAWESLGGALIAAPAAASPASGQLDVFAVGTDRAVYRRIFNGTAWSGWELLGGRLTSDLGAVSWGQGRIDVFGRATDNALWHRAFNGSSWSNWESLGGVLASGPAATSWGFNRIDLYVVGTDGTLYHKFWNGSTWNGWQYVGGTPTTTPAAVAPGPGVIDLFIRGTDQQLWQKTFSGL